MPFRKFGAPEKGDAKFEDTDEELDSGAFVDGRGDAGELDDVDGADSAVKEGPKASVRRAWGADDGK